jgi:hypothetical protein
MEFQTRLCTDDEICYDDPLDNESRLFAPVSPLHPLWDDIRRDWLRDWQVT